MNTYEVVLSNGNDERHFYEEALTGTDAVVLARKEWSWEFGTTVPGPQVHAVLKKKF